MVEVIYDRKHCRLTAVGHAGSAPRGKDLVCAGVSALVLTLAGNVAGLAVDGQVRRHVLRLQEGDAWISCVPAPGRAEVVTLIFDAVCSGFELLETLHPENIRYRVLI